MLNHELDRAVALAERAGELAMTIYRREFSVEEKANRSPVTEADQVVNAFLVDAISSTYPGDLVVGEESAPVRDLASERAWFIDPVDGTKDFILKNDEWSIMLGLVIEGRAVLGVVYQPTIGKMYVATSGGGAFERSGGTSRTLRVSTGDATKDATVVLSRNHPDPHTKAMLAALNITRSYQHGSVGCKLAQIAEQRADLYFNFSGKCHMWDTCGPEVLLREAGGALVALDGSPIQYVGTTTQVQRPFVATTQALLPQVIRVANETESAARDATDRSS